MPIIFFQAEKLPKRLSLFSNIFYQHNWVFNFDISFLEGEKLKSSIHSHRFQYSKILKSSHWRNVMTSLQIKLIK